MALTTPVGAPVCPPDPSITVYSDASNQGWGAALNPNRGMWSPEEIIWNYLLPS